MISSHTKGENLEGRKFWPMREAAKLMNTVDLSDDVRCRIYRENAEVLFGLVD